MLIERRGRCLVAGTATDRTKGCGRTGRGNGTLTTTKPKLRFTYQTTLPEAAPDPTYTQAFVRSVESSRPANVEMSATRWGSCMLGHSKGACGSRLSCSRQAAHPISSRHLR